MLEPTNVQLGYGQDSVSIVSRAGEGMHDSAHIPEPKGYIGAKREGREARVTGRLKMECEIREVICCCCSLVQVNPQSWLPLLEAEQNLCRDRRKHGLSVKRERRNLVR